MLKADAIDPLKDGWLCSPTNSVEAQPDFEDWTCCESVRLVAAVSKSNPINPDWNQVSRLMLINPAKVRSRDFYRPEQCSTQFDLLRKRYGTFRNVSEYHVDTEICAVDKLLNVLASDALLEKSQLLGKEAETKSDSKLGRSSTASTLDTVISTDTIVEDAVQLESPAKSLSEDCFQFITMEKPPNFVMPGPIAFAKKSRPISTVGHRTASVAENLEKRHFPTTLFNKNAPNCSNDSSLNSKGLLYNTASDPVSSKNHMKFNQYATHQQLIRNTNFLESRSFTANRDGMNSESRIKSCKNLSSWKTIQTKSSSIQQNPCLERIHEHNAKKKFRPDHPLVKYGDNGNTASFVQHKSITKASGMRDEKQKVSESSTESPFKIPNPPKKKFFAKLAKSLVPQTVPSNDEIELETKCPNFINVETSKTKCIEKTTSPSMLMIKTSNESVSIQNGPVKDFELKTTAHENNCFEPIIVQPNLAIPETVKDLDENVQTCTIISTIDLSVETENNNHVSVNSTTPKQNGNSDQTATDKSISCTACETDPKEKFTKQNQNDESQSIKVTPKLQEDSNEPGSSSSLASNNAILDIRPFALTGSFASRPSTASCLTCSTEELTYIFRQTIALIPSDFFACATTGYPEGNSAAIKQPMDLLTIKNMIDERRITTIPELDRLLCLTFFNAIMVHDPNHIISQKACSAMHSISNFFKEFRAKSHHCHISKNHSHPSLRPRPLPTLTPPKRPLSPDITDLPSPSVKRKLIKSIKKRKRCLI